MMQPLALTIGGTPFAYPTEYTGPKVPERFYNPPVPSVSSMISNALTIFITAGIIAATIMIIWSGIQWTTSGGDKQKVAQAKARLTWGIIGLLVMLLSFFIIIIFGHFFGVDLLNIPF